MFVRIHPISLAASLLGLLLNYSATARVTPAPMLDSQLIYDFTEHRPGRIRVVNDGVMGGRSQGFYQISESLLRFDGELITQGGGFTSIRMDGALDLADFTGIALRVRGNGRDFQLEVSDGLAYRGRLLSRRASFPSAASWHWVQVPFTQLQASIMGQRVSAPDINPGEIQRIGIFIADGTDGDFWLEIDQMRAYRLVDSQPLTPGE